VPNQGWQQQWHLLSAVIYTSSKSKSAFFDCTVVGWVEVVQNQSADLQKCLLSGPVKYNVAAADQGKVTPSECCFKSSNMAVSACGEGTVVDARACDLVGRQKGARALQSAGWCSLTALLQATPGSQMLRRMKERQLRRLLSGLL
jgi:hypothetical protein